MDEGIGYTILTRYEDVSAALRDPDTFSSQLSRRFPAGMSAYEDSPAVKEVLKDACPYHDVLTFVDGDVHARHRRIARRPFTSKHVAELDEIIKDTVTELMAGLPRGEDFDLVSAFSIRLPIIVIGHILGVDPAHFNDVKRWADAQVARLGEPLDDDEENLRYAATSSISTSSCSRKSGIAASILGMTSCPTWSTAVSSRPTRNSCSSARNSSSPGPRRRPA